MVSLDQSFVCVRRYRLPLAVANAAASTILATVLFAIWIHSGTFLEYRECTIHNCQALFRVLFTGPPAVWMLRKSMSKHLRSVAEFMCVGWAFQAMWFTQDVLECGFWEWETFNKIHMFLAAFQQTWYLFVTFALVMERLGALQRESFQNMHIKNIWVLLIAAAVVCQPNVLFMWLVGEFSGKDLFVGVTSYIGLALFLMAVVLMCRGLIKALRLVKAASPERTAGPRIYRTLRLQVAGSIVGVTTSYAFQVISLWQLVVWKAPEDPDGEAWDWGWFVAEASATMEAVANTFLGVALSGMATGALAGAARRAASDRRRRHRWMQAEKARRQEEAVGQGDAEWDAKVHELAHRGVTLDAILSFYKNLGVEIMPDFDASSSTTSEVVYNAIIPHSAKQRCAMATVLMDGRPCRAERMLTHNWSNLFRDMLATVVADALGEADFSKIALMLMKDVGVVESWVRRRDVGSRVYWICAFAVNQHSSICSSPPAPYEPCGCGLPKLLNDAPPLTRDGKSVPCEMNKFDDMMKYLSATSRSFQQVVAVDQQFQLFNRAWCVAEIAAASHCGMRQNLKIWSQVVLAKHTKRLEVLKVQEMEASRKEDAEEILASIHDVDSFNKALRDLLLEDLIPAWNSLDSEEQMVLAGQMIRWHFAGSSLHRLTDQLTE